MGLDAENAETQEIVDEEIIELEEAGKFGDFGVMDSKTAKRAKGRDRVKDFLKDHAGHDNVGKNKWVEQKDWWKEHAPDMDVSTMSTKEAKQYMRMKEKEERKKKRHDRLCKRRPELCPEGPDGEITTDLDSIKNKLHHFNYEDTGAGKGNYPAKEKPHHKHNDKPKHNNSKPAKEKPDTEGEVNDEPKLADEIKQAINEEIENEDENGPEGGVNDEPATAKESEQPADENVANEDKEPGLVQNSVTTKDAAQPANEAEEAGQQAVDNGKTSAAEEPKEEVQTPVAGEEADVVANDEEVIEPEGEVKSLNTIVNTFTIMEQVGHDKSSFT